MKVKLLREFGGRETGEMHFPAGHVLDVDEDLAFNLAQRGIVEIVAEPVAVETPMPEIPEQSKPEPETATIKPKLVKKGGKK